MWHFPNRIGWNLDKITDAFEIVSEFEDEPYDNETQRKVDEGWRENPESVKRGTLEFNGRKMINQFWRIGFVHKEQTEDGKKLKVTEAGRKFLNADSEDEKRDILTRAVMKWEFNNPTYTEDSSVSGDAKIKPYWAVLRLLQHFHVLSDDEIARFVIHIKSPEDVEEAIQNGIEAGIENIDEDLEDIDYDKKDRNSEWLRLLFKETKYLEVERGGLRIKEGTREEVESLLDGRIKSVERGESVESKLPDLEETLENLRENESIKILDDYYLIQDEKNLSLLVKKDVVENILISLTAGKHVIIGGPTGTGKTHLAKLITEKFFSKNFEKNVQKEIYRGEGMGFYDEEEYIKNYLGNPSEDGLDNVTERVDQSIGYYPEMVTATADWTTYDLIGGVKPVVEEGNMKFGVEKGHVYESILKNWDRDMVREGNWVRDVHTENDDLYRGAWLVIDELNRADVDKAFGGLFTALEYGHLQVPSYEEESPKRIKIPEDYRIIGTLNTFDYHYLHKLSDAFKRRFSFVWLDPPADDATELEKYVVSQKVREELSENYPELEDYIVFEDQEISDNSADSYLKTLDYLFDFARFLRLFRPLGTSQLITTMRFFIISQQVHDDSITSLDHAISTNLARELEGMRKIELEILKSWCDGTLPEKLESMSQDLSSEEERVIINKCLIYLLGEPPSEDVEEIDWEKVKEKWDESHIEDLQKTALALEKVFFEKTSGLEL